MAGIGFRRAMADWDMTQLKADFFEVVPENWLRRDPAPLLQLGRPLHLHGVSLNLGGTSDIKPEFVRAIRTLMDELGTEFYSDHLAASGDAHQLYDLFPVPFVSSEISRIGDRIRRVQDMLGCAMAIENATWYSNHGDIPEADFLMAVADYADCRLLLDLNNIEVNFKNHGLLSVKDFIARIDLTRVNYLHVAGHEYDARFGLYVDTHSRGVNDPVRQLALQLHDQHGLPILLEWDNDLPDMATLNQELQCLTSTTL